MDIVTQLELLETKLQNQEKVVRLPGGKNAPARSNRIAGFISRHVILVVLLTFSITTVATAYFNPDARQWVSESEAASKIVSFIEFDYNQKTGQALIARGNALRVKEQFAEAEAEDAYQEAIEKFTFKEDYTAQQHYKATNNLEGFGNVSLGLGKLHVAKKDYPQATKYFTEAESKLQLVENKRGLVSVYNSLSHAFEVLRTKRGKEEAAQYRQVAKAIELDTHSTTLPKFSIQESLSWLTSAFNQNRDAYESEQNLKPKQEEEL